MILRQAVQVFPPFFSSFWERKKTLEEIGIKATVSTSCITNILVFSQLTLFDIFEKTEIEFDKEILLLKGSY